jgi:hypothetical protein
MQWRPWSLITIVAVTLLAACGAPAMIAAARADYFGKGQLAEDAFFADAFEFAAN